MRQTTEYSVKILEGDYVMYENGHVSRSNLDIDLHIDSVKSVYSPRLMPDVWHEYECSYSGVTFREWLQHEILNNRYIVLKRVYKRENKAPCEGKIVEIEGEKYELRKVKG